MAIIYQTNLLWKVDIVVNMKLMNFCLTEVPIWFWKIRLQDLNFNFIRNLIVRHFISRCSKREKSHDEKSKSYYLL